MYAFKLRYLASIFVNAESIVPNNKYLPNLLEQFSTDDFQLITVQEPTTQGAKPRIGFISPEQGFQFILGSSRFDFAKLPINQDGSNLGDFSTFCTLASQKLSNAAHALNLTPSRLAVVQEGMLEPQSEEDYNKLVKKIFVFPPSYQESLPFEWSWKAVNKVARTFGDIEEPTNTAATISRVAGFISNQREPEIPFDRIRVDLDINTYPENIIPRFSPPNIEEFFKNAVTWHSALYKEIEEFITN